MDARTPVEVVVAGHLCLDVIPALPRGLRFVPGTLREVGPVTFAPGGAVANVGLSLAALGVRVALVGRLGGDAFGEVLRGLLEARQPGSTGGLVVAEDATSYTLVINPPDVDRLFLHHAGSNDGFRPGDVDAGLAAAAEVFYFGYPPLLRRAYEDGGAALAGLLRGVRAGGGTTVLDLAMPDAAGPAGRVDWGAFLSRVLPHVDLVAPSLDEVAPMVGRRVGSTAEGAAVVADALLGLGAGAALVTLGAGGAVLATGTAARLGGSRFGAAWSGRRLWAPALAVEAVGTTGAGDATVAGLIAALLRGDGPERALALATAAGASSVEAADATSGVRSLEATRARLEAGWPRRPPADAGAWRRLPSGLYAGPGDAPAT